MAAREKKGVFEMARNGLVVRVEVTVSGGGRRSKWTAAQIGAVSDSVTVDNMNKLKDAPFWELNEKPGTEPSQT